MSTSTSAVAGAGAMPGSSTPARSEITALSVALLVVSALMFSTGGLFVRALDHPQAWTTVFWRSVSASLSLIALIAWRERENTKRVVISMGRPGWAVAASFSASSIGLVVAMTRTTVAIVLVIFSLSPLVAALFAWVLIGERVHRYTWFAIGVTVVGVAFMVSGPDAGGFSSGALIAFVIPLAFGFGAVTIRQHAEITMAPAMLLATVISALISLPFAHPFSVTRHDFLVMFVFGFAQLGVGLAIFSVGAARTPATEVALIAMLEPIMGPIWVWIFKNEYPGVSSLIGGSVVFVALAAHTLYASKRARLTRH